MSLNAVLEQKYLPEVEALQSLLVVFLGRWKGAETEEERLLIEAEVVAVFDRLLDLTIQYEEVVAGANPDSNDFITYFQEQDYLIRTNLARLRRLGEQYIRYFNTQRVTLLELSGKLRRIKQKQATLGLWDQEQARFVVSESFLTLDNLDSNLISDPEAQVDTAQGCLLLPVRAVTKVTPERVRIGSGSNGQPGSSDVVVVTPNNKPEYMLNGNSEDWFEYERLDAGPLELVLVFEFAQEQILNQLVIEPINLGLSGSCQVSDAVFSGSGGTQHIADLVGEPDLVVKPVGNDTKWVLNHLPVKAKTVTLKLVQTQSYGVGVVTRDRRTVVRNRYAVGIKSISFNRVEYLSVGAINSRELEIPATLYAALPLVDSFPADQRLYGIKLDVSFDGGQSWQEDLTGARPKTALLSGTESSAVWRLKLTRDDAAFTNLTTLVGDQPRYEVDSLLRTVSRYQSPAEISLPEKPVNGTVFVLQPKLLRRGDKYKGIVVGESLQDSSTVLVPFSILDYDIDPDSVRVLVNNREWERVESEDDLSSGLWCFSEDYKEIIFSEHSVAGSKIKILLDEERMDLEERADGFYHRMEMLFDPDVDNIEIQLLPRVQAGRNVVVPRGKTLIPLLQKNLVEGSVVLVGETGTYTEVAARSSLAAAGDYYVDYVNGVVYLYEAITDDNVRLSYKHLTPRKVGKSEFEVIYENSRPWGVRIAKQVLQGYSHTDTIGDSVGSRVNILTGRTASRTDSLGAANSRSKTLTHDYVIRGSVVVPSNLFDSVTTTPEEVDFIDGYSEFLGLIEMNSESTTETSVLPSESVATFTLSAGALWHSELGISFSDTTVFGTEVATAAAVNSAGEYHIDRNTGLVTVYVGLGGTLAADIEIRYMYRDPGFDPTNKYSVDYRNGILHSFSALRTGATITYKSAPMKVAYDVALEVDRYSYNPASNSVQVRTEGLFESNSLIKVLWSKPTTGTTVEDLRKYFTPMVKLLGFRFN